MTRFKIELVHIGDLLETELTDPQNERRVLHKILRAGHWTRPIWIEAATGAVMDGHHRMKAAAALRIDHVPCLKLDYSEVDVQARRADYIVTPNEILRRARDRDPYPPKSTRHQLRGIEPVTEDIPLDQIRELTFSEHQELVWARSVLPNTQQWRFGLVAHAVA